MKLPIVLSLSLFMLATADGQAKKNPVPASPAPNEIPSGAVKSDDGAFHYTDRQGKKWIYRKTPFGIARLEDKPAHTEDPANHFEDVKATQDGDTIRFERPGPFGIYKWQRNKNELNEMEQTVWDRERARTEARQD